MVWGHANQRGECHHASRTDSPGFSARVGPSDSHRGSGPALRHLSPVGPPPPRLLDRVQHALQTLHRSRRTQKAYVGWIRRCILFHDKRHPAEIEPKKSRSSSPRWPSSGMSPLRPLSGALGSTVAARRLQVSRNEESAVEVKGMIEPFPELHAYQKCMRPDSMSDVQRLALTHGFHSFFSDEPFDKEGHDFLKRTFTDGDKFVDETGAMVFEGPLHPAQPYKYRRFAGGSTLPRRRCYTLATQRGEDAFTLEAKPSARILRASGNPLGHHE